MHQWINPEWYGRSFTAALGLLFFSLFGWIELDYVFVNPTYLWSTIVGGVIMGLGFIMGGFCPGTSFCGAAIVKIDALVFVGGLFIGILIFAEGFPLWQNLYLAKFLGTVTIYDALDLSPGVFVLLLILVAAGMFWVGEWAERKFHREEY
ncbi:MAG: YeeE/YedE thiosulfate transporter family protein [Bacteroidales bacterium]|nr:YeeE/YedE family protein [Lentimicrobiaceae bacterium]MDD5693695.1 YeeE/YedE thiosulfate transporter family protein [Bacteroidales bacterium]